MDTDEKSPEGIPRSEEPEKLTDHFKAAITGIATPVSVVTSDGAAGRVGLTVSAVSVVSVDPPLILACVDQRSPANEIIQGNEAFRVNLLGLRHDHVADTFAGRPWPGKERWDFTCGDWDLEAENGPGLVDAVASIGCQLDSVVPAGTHNIYLGVATDSLRTERQPLLYYRRTYCRAVEEPPTVFPDQPDAKPTYVRTRSA
jgi:flavin reductase